MQTILRRLEREGLIEIIPKKSKSGAQRCNAYRYIGPPCKKYGSGLTLQVLHSPKRDVGFRGWAWKEYEFRHDRLWHNFLPFCKEKFKARIARRKYLEENNLPLVIPEDTKYLVLRYCYWRGTEDELCRQFQNARMQSLDGTKKLSLYPLGRTERVKLFGRNISVVFGGEMENPQITLIDETGKQLDVFSWFDENIIEATIELGGELVEEFVVVGDFTTK